MRALDLIAAAGWFTGSGRRKAPRVELPKEKTQFDHEQIAAAEAKRARKAQKRKNDRLAQLESNLRIQ